MPGPEVVFGYVGPGADLNLVGYALTLAGFAMTALSAVFLYPMYSFLRWIRGVKKTPPPIAPAEPAENRPEEVRDP